MPTPNQGVTFHFKLQKGHTYHLDLKGPGGEDYEGTFALPYDPATWAAILQALEPTFILEEAPDLVRAALQPLGDLANLQETVGAALADALLADLDIRTGFNVALGRAGAANQPLPVVLRFGYDCDLLASLPWELLYCERIGRGRHFVVADSSIVLSRCPASAEPPVPALAPLPLRVLLVLSEPLDASPIFPERAGEALSYGLQKLDEQGAVVVDRLEPPTYDKLIEAVTNGGYQVLVFYGHGVYDKKEGGQLLFEDDCGGGAPVKAVEMGTALHNTPVRLVLLGACQSAQVGTDGGGKGDVWHAIAPALLQAGVPLAIGMQVSMRVDAAQAFIRQFALSLAAGKAVSRAVADARKPLVQKACGRQWFVPVLYGRPADAGRLFDPGSSLPAETAELRAEMKALRAEIATLEAEAGRIGCLQQPGEILRLRAARRTLVQKRARLAQQVPGGYTQVTTPLYGVPANPIFVGRSGEMRRLGQAFRGDRPVVLWGTGGIGKTALAAEAALRQRWRFPAGVLWLDCRGGPALETLLGQLAAFCGIEALDQWPPEQRETAVRQGLAGLGDRCLLVWDNVEDLGDDHAVRGFLGVLPSNCQLLLTTREDPERAMWETAEVRPLVERAMATLFTRLAAAAGVKIGGPADLEVLPEIVNWLQGHPLALTLVVPLMKKRGIRRVWDALQAHPIQGVRAAFEVSYERLRALQQRLFARLSVLTVPFTWEAAAALLPGEEEVEGLLDGLVQRALVTFDGARYSYHPLVRQYAYEKLQEREDPRPVHKAAATYLDAKLKGGGGTPEEGLEVVDQWERSGEWESFARAASALVGSLNRLGYWPEIQVRLERALAALRDHLEGQEELQARLLNDLGIISTDMAQWDRAIGFYEQSLETKERVGDIHGMAQTYGNLGSVYLQKGEWDRAIGFYEQSLETLERVGDIHGMAQTYVGLGNIYANKGEWDRAIGFYEQSLETFERVGDIHGMASTWCNMGMLYLRTERAEEAKPLLARAYLVFAQLGSPNAKTAAGALVQACGSVDAANTYLEKLVSEGNTESRMGNV